MKSMLTARSGYDFLMKPVERVNLGSGRRGKLPSPAPHRSGHAQLTHPAPHIVDSLRDATAPCTRGVKEHRSFDSVATL
jgi:hypothetical protein